MIRDSVNRQLIDIAANIKHLGITHTQLLFHTEYQLMLKCGKDWEETVVDVKLTLDEDDMLHIDAKYWKEC